MKSVATDEYGFPSIRSEMQTRADVLNVLHQLCDPLRRYYSAGRARLRIGNTSASYGRMRCMIESFARPFWGLAPLAAGGGSCDLLAISLQGLINGTDPKHAEYWGSIHDNDQLAVEMPPLALSLALAPHVFWEPLTPISKASTVSWLNQINQHKLPESNWQTFPLLVNTSLKRLGANYDPSAIERALTNLENFYLGDGWYSDGLTNRRDYYVSFAIYFALLIYARLMAPHDQLRTAKYRKRAVAFAQDFVYWFTAEGAALPFGRSLTYRFAQGAFWGALAFADVEALPWGVIKGLYLRHLRHWYRLPLFTSDGLLTLGYAYPNLTMTEYYNGPGSPYWAMKAFLPLALPSEHPFWTASEQPMPQLKGTVLQKHAYMSISRSPNGNHIIALTSGQWCARDFGHIAAKYSKFAYSTHFGFSISREATGLEHGAYDSMLALSDGEDVWRVRRDCELFTVTETSINSLWRPWPDVQVHTELIDRFPWHLRIHTIKTGRALETAEGSFAAAFDDGVDPLVIADQDPHGVLFEGSGIRNLEGDRVPLLVTPVPNTNLLHPRTVIPTLRGRLVPGEYRLVCSVLGEPDVNLAKELWRSPPRL